MVVFGVCLLLIGWTDWRWRKIWHAVTFPMGICGIAAASVLPAGSWANALFGGAGAFLLFFAIWWLANGWYGALSFGFGDVTLATVLGIVGGVYWGSWMLAIGMLLAGAASAAALLLKRRQRLDSIPYGTFLCLGGVIVLLIFSLGG